MLTIPPEFLMEPEVEDVPAAPAAPSAEGFHLNGQKWAGVYPIWECDTCPYTSIDRDQIIDHVENAAERNAELGVDPEGLPLNPEEVQP